MIRKAKLTKEQLALIHAHYGHSSGRGLSIYDVQAKHKVHVSNPIFIENISGNRHTVIAKGRASNGHEVSQIVKYRC